MTDDELIWRGLAGDQAALIKLYWRYRPRVYGYLRRLTGDPDLTETVFVATFACVLERLEEYSLRGQFTVYLFRIARSRLMAEWTARDLSEAINHSGPLDDLPYPQVGESLGSVSELELTELVESAVEQLPTHLREAVLLRVYDGQDYSTIGQILGIPEVTVRSRMRYALQYLRQALPGPLATE